MTTEKIDAPKINKPIQLLAAWLSGLVITNASFLGAAATLKSPSWGPGALVVAAISNVPLFMACIFLLQTKFRPEMQEDSYYSTYLERRYSEESRKSELFLEKISTSKIKELPEPNHNPISVSDEKYIKYKFPQIDGDGYQISINDLLPNFSAISDSIKASGLLIGDSFGSTSSPPEPPNPFVLSFGAHTSVEAFQKTLGAVWDKGLEGVAFTDAEYNHKRIYVGAYSYGPNDRPFAPFSARLMSEIMNRNMSIEEIEKIIVSRSLRKNSE